MSDAGWITLCRLDDIPPGGARAFTALERSLLVVRLGARDLRVYLNRCPHLGVPLQWRDEDFLDADGALIRCATHGALFDKDSGLCLLGPCRDDFLWNIDSRVEGGAVLIDPAELPPPRSRDA